MQSRFSEPRNIIEKMSTMSKNPINHKQTLSTVGVKEHSSNLMSPMSRDKIDGSKWILSLFDKIKKHNKTEKQKSEKQCRNHKSRMNNCEG
jgi:hypothetical protein